MRSTAFPLPLAFLAATAVTAGADNASRDGALVVDGGVLTYEAFEAAVEHVDLATCPARFDPDAVFCRMTLASGGAHVFAFAFDGDQPLVAITSYDIDDIVAPF